MREFLVALNASFTSMIEKGLNERAWGEQNHFAPLIPFAKGLGGKGREFCHKLPRPFVIALPLRSRFCYLSMPTTHASKTKQKIFSVN